MHRYSHFVVAAVGCGISFGCTSSDASTAGGAYEALASQLQNCGSAALDCLKAASCDETKERACRDDFDACRSDNGALLQAFQQSIQACCDTRKECVATARGDAGTAGSGGASSMYMGHHMLHMQGVEACRDDYAMCIGGHELAAPPAGPCMQGFHDCIKVGDQDARGCVSAARSCFLNRLPTCDRDHSERITP